MPDPEPILLSVCCLGCHALPCACPTGIEVTEEVPADNGPHDAPFIERHEIAPMVGATIIFGDQLAKGNPC